MLFAEFVHETIRAKRCLTLLRCNKSPSEGQLAQAQTSKQKPMAYTQSITEPLPTYAGGRIHRQLNAIMLFAEETAIAAHPHDGFPCSTHHCHILVIQVPCICHVHFLIISVFCCVPWSFVLSWIWKHAF